MFLELKCIFISIFSDAVVSQVLDELGLGLTDQVRLILATPMLEAKGATSCLQILVDTVILKCFDGQNHMNVYLFSKMKASFCR